MVCFYVNYLHDLFYLKFEVMGEMFYLYIVGTIL